MNGALFSGLAGYPPRGLSPLAEALTQAIGQATQAYQLGRREMQELWGKKRAEDIQTMMALWQMEEAERERARQMAMQMAALQAEERMARERMAAEAERAETENLSAWISRLGKVDSNIASAEKILYGQHDISDVRAVIVALGDLTEDQKSRLLVGKITEDLERRLEQAILEWEEEKRILQQKIYGRIIGSSPAIDTKRRRELHEAIDALGK